MFETIRQTLRSLSRAPGLTFAAVATVALGAAFTTSMVAVVDGILFRPLPFRDADRIVVMRDVNVRTQERNEVSAPNFEDVIKGSQTLDRAALWSPETASLSGDGTAERINVVRVSPSIFTTLGITPIVGRGFGDELFAKSADSIVLSHELWQTRFHGSPTVIGKVLRLDAKPYVIAGVLPPELRFPWGEADVWQPLVLRDYEHAYRAKRMFNAVAHLAPGATHARAAAEVAQRSATLAAQFPDNRGWTTELVPVRAAITPNARSIWLLLAGAGLVLLLACANVANLLLARATAMRQDAVVRAALGATRWSLAMESLRESAVIAAAGTTGGVFIAAWIVRIAVAFGPAALPSWSHVAVDLRILGASVALLVLTTLLAGTIPALMASEAATDSLRAHGRIGERRGGRVRRNLTALQVGLAVVLLVGAMLLLRSLAALERVDPGFRTGGRVAASLVLPEQIAADRNREIAIFTRFLERIRSTPGVTTAGAVTSLPMNPIGVDYDTDVYISGFVSDRPPEVDLRLASSDYFRTMGISFLEGRDFAGTDDARARKVAIVNAAFARMYAQRRSALGVDVKIYCDRCDAYTIVGVVGDTRHDGLDRAAVPEIYVPYQQLPHGELTMVVSTAGDPARAVAAMRSELQRLDPDLALAGIATLDEIVAGSVGARRFNTQLLTAFSACAFLLAAIGLYGSLSFSIAQRRRDIAVRMALGAERVDLWKLVAAEASRPVVIGVAGGLAASILATRALRSMIFGVTAADPVTYGVVLLSFALVIALVTTAGVHRASRTDVQELLSDS